MIDIPRGFTNPVIPGVHPDPSVCRVDDESSSDVQLGAVRMRFDLVPETSGRFRLMGAAMHRARLVVDCELVTSKASGCGTPPRPLLPK